MAAADRYDVIVVGGGIMGSCAAHAAAARGRSTLLLERFDVLHHRGSSHGESRTIRATYPEAYYPPLARVSRRLWDEAQAEAGYAVLTPTAHLDVGPGDHAGFAAVVANGGEGTRAASWSQVAERWGGTLRFPDGWAAVVSEFGGVIKPTKAVAMFQALAMKKGAAIRDRMEVVDIKKDDMNGEGIVVKTANGEVFRGAKCIVTVGGWTRKLVKTVSGLDLPIQPLHTLVCYWKIKAGRESELTPEAGFPTFASYGDPYIYGTPSMEFPGLIKIGMHGGPRCDPDRRDWTAGAAAAVDVASPAGGPLVDPVTRWIEMVMPGSVETTPGPVIKQPCMYSMTPDEDFVIDFLGGEFGNDVVIGGGFSGHGFKMGPAVGKILVEMAIDGDATTAAAAGVDLGNFRLGRFRDNPKGNAKEFAEQVPLRLWT